MQRHGTGEKLGKWEGIIKSDSRGARAFITLTVAVAVLFVIAAPVLSDDTQADLVPEMNVFVKLSDTTRLFFLANLTRNLTEGTTDGAVGVHLDMTLKPIFRRQLHEADWERDRYFWVRIGYQYSGNLVGEEGASNENRGIVEATGRAPLPFEVWLVNRLHVDLRFIDGDYSKRYREKLGVERVLSVGGVTAVPYAEAEFFYDARFYAWNRQVYQAGAEVELAEHWRIEPYYARQNDQRSSPAHINRIGIILKTYW
jgi:hypothetical protein